jgi:hypothetical protein
VNQPKESENAALPPQIRQVLGELKKQAKSAAGTTYTGNPFIGQEPTPIDEKLRKQQIANDNAEKDQALKGDTLRKLFRFLWAETAVIFLLAFLQGFTWAKFKLDQWSFRLVITATLGQITAMLTIAVRHLFPRRSSH